MPEIGHGDACAANLLQLFERAEELGERKSAR
jgi:hypothetical protein